MLWWDAEPWSRGTLKVDPGDVDDVVARRAILWLKGARARPLLKLGGTITREPSFALRPLPLWPRPTVLQFAAPDVGDREGESATMQTMQGALPEGRDQADA